MKEILDQYVAEGRLNKRSINKNGITYQILCYSKQAFFAFDWDDVLISHRGKIYRDDGMVPINRPIPKIFNLGEHEGSTLERLEELMATQHYEVLDKVNGHLVIVSPDASTSFKNILVSTKGSFEGLAEEDYKFLFMKTKVIDEIRRLSLNYTFMFEALVDYDKHLWYDEQKARYGGHDNMILLAATDNNTGRELNYAQLKQMAFVLKVPVCTRHDLLVGTDVNKWFEHKGIEGYVVHFPELNHRIKVKTKEYTTLRYFKDMDPAKLVNALYNTGWENLYTEHDEEMYPILDALKDDARVYLFDAHLGGVMNFDPVGKTRKDIASVAHYSAFQRSYLFSWLNGVGETETIERIINSKSFREEFKLSGEFAQTSAAIENMFKEQVALLAEEVTV